MSIFTVSDSSPLILIQAHSDKAIVPTTPLKLLIKITNDFQVAKFHGQVSIFILLNSNISLCIFDKISSLYF